MKNLIKKCAPVYKMIHTLHQKYVDEKGKQEYIRADDIKITYNGCNKHGQKYLIYEYKGTQGLMAQMVGVLTWIKFALENDFILVVDMTDSSNLYQIAGENAWENFYYQPMYLRSASKTDIERIKREENYAFCPLYDRAALLWRKGMISDVVAERYPPTIIHPSTRDYKRDASLQRLFESIYKEYIHFKPDVADYLLKEEKMVLSGG